MCSSAINIYPGIASWISYQTHRWSLKSLMSLLILVFLIRVGFNNIDYKGCLLLVTFPVCVHIPLTNILVLSNSWLITIRRSSTLFTWSHFENNCQFSLVCVLEYLNSLITRAISINSNILPFNQETRQLGSALNNNTLRWNCSNMLLPCYHHLTSPSGPSMSRALGFI